MTSRFHLPLARQQAPHALAVELSWDNYRIVLIDSP